MQLQISFSQFEEDIILWHALSSVDSKDVFYVDAGANDSKISSVTHLFYELGGSGINIEPQIKFKEDYDNNRKRDINLFIGVGEKKEKKILFGDGQSATVNSDSVYATAKQEVIEIDTLTNICDRYVGSNKYIHFLKIDVEGYEEQCLRGMNFNKYRPWIICIESTIPGTDDANYNEWEGILLETGYEFVVSRGANRFYCDTNRNDIKTRLQQMNNLEDYYKVYKYEDYKSLYYEVLNTRAYKMTYPLRKLYTIIRFLRNRNR